jgi:hypothetical protein
MSPRKSYEFKEKRATVLKVNALVAGRFSHHKACRYVGIPTLYYRRWVKLLEKVDTISAGDSYVSNKLTATARKLHSGRKSILTEIAPQLKQFILIMCEQGIQVTNRMVGREASRILPAFRVKSAQAKNWLFIASRSLWV